VCKAALGLFGAVGSVIGALVVQSIGWSGDVSAVTAGGVSRLTSRGSAPQPPRGASGLLSLLGDQHRAAPLTLRCWRRCSRHPPTLPAPPRPIKRGMGHAHPPLTPPPPPPTTDSPPPPTPPPPPARERKTPPLPPRPPAPRPPPPPPPPGRPPQRAGVIGVPSVGLGSGHRPFQPAGSLGLLLLRRPVRCPRLTPRLTRPRWFADRRGGVSRTGETARLGPFDPVAVPFWAVARRMLTSQAVARSVFPQRSADRGGRGAMPGSRGCRAVAGA